MATNAEIKRFLKEVRQEQDRRNLEKFALKTEVASAFKLKGSVANFAALPANASAGDVYNIQAAGGSDAHGTAVKAGDNVVRTVDNTWDILAGTLDTSNFVEKDGEKVLSTNDFTDAYKTQLDGLSTALAGKVDKVTGKQLSTEDFTTAYKTQLDGLSTALDGKVDKVTGKQLSTNDFTDEYVTTIGALSTAVNATFTSEDLTYIFSDN